MLHCYHYFFCLYKPHAAKEKEILVKFKYILICMQCHLGDRQQHFAVGG